jgi:hypothetical protein
MGLREDMQNDFKSTKGDYAHSMVNAAISTLPVAGSFASEIFNMVIFTPLEKRKERWMVSIVEGLEELQEKVNGFNVESLSQNELFISILNRTSQLAISNHQEEKVTALRNAVMNTALNIKIDENEQMMFLNLIDSITPWHIKIIDYFYDPRERFKENNINPTEYMMGSPVSPLVVFYPELVNRDDLINLLVKELYNDGILNIKDLHVSMTSNGMYEPRLTEYGKRFLSFIKEPRC